MLYTAYITCCTAFVRSAYISLQPSASGTLQTHTRMHACTHNLLQWCYNYVVCISSHIVQASMFVGKRRMCNVCVALAHTTYKSRQGEVWATLPYIYMIHTITQTSNTSHHNTKLSTSPAVKVHIIATILTYSQQTVGERMKRVVHVWSNSILMNVLAKY